MRKGLSFGMLLLTVFIVACGGASAPAYNTVSCEGVDVVGCKPELSDAGWALIEACCRPAEFSSESNICFHTIEGACR